MLASLRPLALLAHGAPDSLSSFDAVTQAALPSAEVTSLHLLRHPHAETGGRRLAYGHTDLPLSSRGQRDADELVAWCLARLPRPDGVISSDLERCLAVARPLAAGFGVPLQRSPALREQHMGDWEGAAWEDLTAAEEDRVRAYWTDYLHSRPPNGESFADLAARAGAWWSAAGPSLQGRRWIVVTHIGVIRALACAWLGLPLSDGLRLAPARPSHSLFLHADTGAVMEVFGERPTPLGGPVRVTGPAWESPA